LQMWLERNDAAYLAISGTPSWRTSAARPWP